jgi:hypothetical protein
MPRSTTTRRGFFETIGAAGAVTAGALATRESARGYAANDSLNSAACPISRRGASWSRADGSVTYSRSI